MNTNCCENIKNCNSCDFCDSCNSCDFCDFCNSCYSCYSCDSCDFCNSCYSCYSCDSCESCKGLRMSERMIFCFGEGRFETKGEGYQKNNRVFNVQVSESEWNEIRNNLPTIKIPLTIWQKSEEMTEEEKDIISSWEQMGGYLKRQSYEDAWQEWWSNASKEDKEKILNIPHFNKSIFKEITSIDIKNNDCVGEFNG